MLTSIGRRAIRSVGGGATKSWGAPVYQGIWHCLRVDSTNSANRSLRPPQLSCSAQRAFATGTTTTKKAKSTTTAKPRATTTATRAKTATSKTTKKAAKKPAKKVVKKKAVNKAGRPKAREKKPLTEEKKLKLEAVKKRAELKELKEAALKAPTGPARTAWTILLQEEISKDTKRPVAETAKEAAAKYKSLTPAELEAYNHKANQNRATYQENYKKWVDSHTPDQIRVANNARHLLQRKTGATHRYPPIIDPRIPKRARTARNLFVEERWASGDLKGITVGESAKLLAKEWKDLPASEVKALENRADADKQRYVQEFKTVFHRDPNFMQAITA